MQNWSTSRKGIATARIAAEQDKTPTTPTFTFETLKTCTVSPKEKNESSRLLKEYDILGEIGRGGYGSVFRAVHQTEQKEYAIKAVVIDPEHKDSITQKLSQEVSTLACLSDHQNVVRYHCSWIEPLTNELEDIIGATCGSTDVSPSNASTGFSSFASFGGDTKANLKKENHLCPSPFPENLLHHHFTFQNPPSKRKIPEVMFIVMELCGSATLKTWLSRSKRQVNPTENLIIFKQIVQAVQYIHESGFIHRDISPANVMMKDGQVKIGDFGLAIQKKNPELIDDDEESMSGVGTLTYSSPELRCGKFATEKSDMFSLGVILFEMFQPFETEMGRSIELRKLRSLQLPAEFIANYPQVASVILSLVSPRSSNRPTASELIDHPIFDILKVSPSVCQEPSRSS